MIDQILQQILPTNEKAKIRLGETPLKQQRSLVLSHIIVILAYLVFVLIDIPRDRNIFLISNLICITLISLNLFTYKKLGNHNTTVFNIIFFSMANIAFQYAATTLPAANAIVWLPVASAFSRIYLPKRQSLLMIGLLFAMFSSAELNRSYFEFFVPFIVESTILDSLFSILMPILVCFFLIGITVNEQDRVMSLFKARQKDNLELMESKSAMLAIMSHDIGTPLSIISAYCELLMVTEKLEPQVIKKIEKIHKNSLRIGEIITSVRKLESVENGKLKVQLIETPVMNAFEIAIDLLQEKLASKNISIKFYIDEKYSPDKISVLADPQSLAVNVFQNLISNAIKFSNIGSEIHIFVNIYKNKTVEVKIQDFGIGMPTSLTESVFSAHKPTSRKGTNGEEGTGFGMPLVKVFMDIYKGMIDVTSSVEKGQSGTIFSLTFNQYKSEEQLERIKNETLTLEQRKVAA